jgi:4-diphosphocytidyl-2-C-methyl-D-erythritol kinase
MPLDGSNLVSRALLLARRTAGVHVRKAIPHGGGLGGGSADAAAILRWAGFTDLVAASRLGADIPFCLVGGRARVTGIGEVIDPHPSTESINQREITLIIPPLQVATPSVYRAWDRLDPAASTGNRNDLEQAAIVVEPELARWRDRIIEHFGVTPTLAGSGATWFVEHIGAQGVDDAGHVASLARLEALGATIVRTHTVDAVRATGPGA